MTKPFTPEDTLTHAATAPNGITLPFDSVRRRENFRMLLYRTKTKYEESLKKEWEESGGDGDFPLTGWEDVRISIRGPRVLWVGVPTMEDFGILEVVEE